MATATARGDAVANRRARVPLVLIVLALLSFVYIPFLISVYMYPSMRDFGFGTLEEIRNKSGLFLGLILLLTLYFWHRATPAPAVRAPSSTGGEASRAAPSGQGPRVVRVAAEDPSARPGAPPAYYIPAAPPDELQGGWQRYKFPEERTGGVYIDVDVRIDDLTRPRGDGTTPRGLYILRVRDEVERVCVQCDLIGHCNGKVAALITREEMLGNFECVPGLKKMVNAKIESMKKQNEEASTKGAQEASSPGPLTDEAPAQASVSSPDAARPERPSD